MGELMNFEMLPSDEKTQEQKRQETIERYVEAYSILEADKHLEKALFMADCLNGNNPEFSERLGREVVRAILASDRTAAASVERIRNDEAGTTAQLKSRAYGPKIEIYKASFNEILELASGL